MIRRYVLLISGLLLSTVLFGMLGYQLLEGWGWLDALYMTVITLTTVGFGEVIPLSAAGRIFTIVLILLGALIVAYSLRLALELFSSGVLLQALRGRRIIKITDHCIICGFGRVGQHIAGELKAEGVPFVVIDLTDDAIARCQALSYPHVHGDATRTAVLEQAGIAKAKFVVTVADEDSTNVFIVLTVRELREDVLILSRTNRDESVPKLRKAGANEVLSPYALIGHRIVNMIKRPGATGLLSTALEAYEIEIGIEDVDVLLGSQLANKTLGEVDLRHQFGVTALALISPEAGLTTHPGAETLLTPGSRLIVMGTYDELKQLEAWSAAVA